MELRSLTEISNDSLLEKVKALHSKSCEMTAELILHLAEMERRKLYLVAGFSSLHRYCIEELKCSEAGANRRVRAAWCLMKAPEVYEKVKRGETTLTALAEISPVITNENGSTVIQSILGKSTREVQCMRAELSSFPVKRT